MPIIKKVRNWKDYNTSLKKRGEIIFNMTEEYFESLYYKDPQKKGGIRKYNKEMFHLILAVKVTFRLVCNSKKKSTFKSTIPRWLLEKSTTFIFQKIVFQKMDSSTSKKPTLSVVRD